MRFFNESEEYWGDIVEPLVNAGNGRLHSRSVKMFADGDTLILALFSILTRHARCS